MSARVLALAGPRHSLGAGIWRLADPKISLASLASMFLGACAAARAGPIAWGWLAATVLGIFAIEVAKNASGEIFDFDSGTDRAIAPEDRSPFSGGKRVLVDGLLTRGETAAIAASGYVLGAACGLGILFWREPKVLWLGIAGMACAYFYHAPPFRLSYRGLGEPAVALCYGPLICCGTYLVQRGSVLSSIVALSVPLGILIAGFLWINEFPDYRADLLAGKRTLVVRLGRRAASLVFAGLIVAAFVLLLLEPLFGLPTGVWLGAVGFVPASFAARSLHRNSKITARIVPAQKQTLLAFLLVAIGSGLGSLF
jgi:1,4-dihydroxy-2-naphthoate polyprenyltransferase